MAWSKKRCLNRLVLTKQFPLGLQLLNAFQKPMWATNKIWNSCVWHSREIRKTENRWPTEAELKAKFKVFAS